MKKLYYTTFDYDGMQDEVIICSPQREAIAVIPFWHCHSDEARKNARLIVDALNAYQHRTFITKLLARLKASLAKLVQACPIVKGRR